MIKRAATAVRAAIVMLAFVPVLSAHGETHKVEITPDGGKLLGGMWQTVNCQASTLDREEPLDADRPMAGVYPYHGDCVKMLFGSSIYNENGLEDQRLDIGVGTFSFYFSAIYRSICDFEFTLTFTNRYETKEYKVKANDSMMLGADPIAQHVVLSGIDMIGEVEVKIELDTTGSIYTTTDPALIWDMEWSDFGRDSVGEISCDENGSEVYYDLTGRVTEPSKPGVYICRKGDRTTKVLIN